MWNIQDISKKYFAESVPANYTKASLALGTGTNGKLTITSKSDVKTSEKVTVAVATGASAALSVAEASGVITITLGTTSTAGTADDTKNTVKLIAAAINAADIGFEATYSGTGASAISAASSNNTFTDGSFGTPTYESDVGFISGTTLYFCHEPDGSKYNTGWQKATLSTL